MELSIFSAATALIAAAALTWLVLRFFFGTQKATAGAMDASGERQSATITVKGGYSPAVISMRTGTPITLTFDRQETGECTSHVVFADLGLDAMLPGNATTSVPIAGPVTYTGCCTTVVLPAAEPMAAPAASPTTPAAATAPAL